MLSSHKIQFRFSSITYHFDNVLIGKTNFRVVMTIKKKINCQTTENAPHYLILTINFSQAVIEQILVKLKLFILIKLKNFLSQSAAM